jgi:hypothetical protein
MTREEEILATLTDEDLARVDALARADGVSREEMLCRVVRSGVEVCEGPRSGVRGPGKKDIA